MTFIYLIVVAFISGFVAYQIGESNGHAQGWASAKAVYSPAPVKVAVATPVTKATPKVAVAAKKTTAKKVAKTAKKAKTSSKR